MSSAGKGTRRWVAGTTVALAAAAALMGSVVPASATTSLPLPHHREALIGVHVGGLGGLLPHRGGWYHHGFRGDLHHGARDWQHRR